MLTDKRYKQLMASVGMPNSISLLKALQQCAMESAFAEREACATLCDTVVHDRGLIYDARCAAQACAASIRSRTKGDQS